MFTGKIAGRGKLQITKALLVLTAVALFGGAIVYERCLNIPRDNSASCTTVTSYVRPEEAPIMNAFDNSINYEFETIDITKILQDAFPANIEFLSTESPEDAFEIFYERHYSRYKSLYGDESDSQMLKFSGGRRPKSRTYLLAPLRYKRISSDFSASRMHPIYNIAKPHLGIDYAAPLGTPVRAIAAGEVVYTGRDGGFGRTVRIMHSDGKVSHYGHLSRYADGIKKGKAVKMGDIIGNVGISGIATGPHLDFRISFQGKFINPLSLDSQGAIKKPERTLAKNSSIKQNRELTVNSSRKAASISSNKKPGGKS